MRLIGYLRVSSSTQLDGYGLHVQQRDCREWCARNDHRIVKWCRDEAVSGTLDASERTGLAEALDGISSHHSGRAAEGIIMGKLDRLARSLTVQEATLALAWRAGGRVFTAADGEILQDDPEDPMRTAMRQMMGVFSQLERTIIVGRLRAGRTEKSRQGGYAFGAPPFGSHSVDKELTPLEQEQQTLARMLELREAGNSFQQIALVLNQEGRSPKRGSRWYPMTISRALVRATK
jgi:DNA invertase Pin-like site-specific DNA recombinase